MQSLLDIIDDPSHTVRISIPNSNGSGLVKGVLLEDFSFNGSSNWNVSGGELDMVNSAVSLYHTGKEVISQVVSGGSALAGSRVKSRVAPRILTAATWGGSSRPSFNVAFGMYCLTASDNILTDIQPLYDMVLPALVTDLKETAPNNYQLEIGGKVKSGTVSLAIGHWFAAHALVCTEVSVQLSKKLNKQGKPLTAIANATFMPANSIDASIMKSYLRP